MLPVQTRRDYVQTHYATDGEAAVADVLGMTCKAVKNMAWRMGLLQPVAHWTVTDDTVLREWYARVVQPDGFLADLAAQLGRTRAAVALRASRLGLASYSHRRVKQRKVRSGRSHARYTPAERRALKSAQQRRWLAEHSHPRGALGLIHSVETRQRIGTMSRRSQAQQTPAQRAARSAKAVRTKMERYGSGNPGALGRNAYSRCQRGRRVDLGNQFFRSAWEANYARLLTFQVAHGLIRGWAYEPTTFVFHGEVRGVVSYTPDFRIIERDGSERYDEIKGWMTSKDRTKLARMAKHYPTVRLRLVGESDYRTIDRQCRGLIPGWE